MRFIAVTVAALALAGNASAATYYVSAAGSDSNAGTSASAPWRTIAKVDNKTFAPGDTILFRGGDTFSDKTLMPTASGTASAPITFGSYGTGRATISNTQGAVWFSGKSWLTFANLSLTTNGGASAIFAGSGSAGSSNIVLRDSVLANTGGIGVNSPNRADAAWTISGNQITNTGDSGLILLGSGDTVSGNTIAHTGGNAAITWGKHGIYAKGPDMTISGNDFSDNQSGQSISVRFHGARVIGNTIHDTPAAIAFFDYDTAAAPQGTSYIYGNRGWNITNWVFYYSNYPDPQGHPPTVDFVLASNTFQLANASEAVNVSESGSAKVTIANNVFTGSYGSALRTAPTTVEHHNLWYGFSSNRPAGAADLFVAPGLSAAPALAPSLGVPVVDAGSLSNAGVSYTASCSGAALSYCGSAPDLGAMEFSGAVAVAPPPPPPPLAAPTSLTASSVTTTGLSLRWTPAADTRVTSYQVSRNATTIATTSSTSLAVSGLACGTSYSFAVRSVAVDSTTSTAATLTASTAACPDTTPPWVVISSPSRGAIVPLTFSFTADPRDAGGIHDVTFWVDSVQRCVVTVSPWRCTVTVRAGSHTLLVRARDNAGNISWASIPVTAR